MMINQDLIKPHSPLDQLRRRNSVRTEPSAAKLGPRDQAELMAVLGTDISYIDSEEFRKPGAEDRIMNPTEAVPTPNTSWYHPVMENPSDDRYAKSVVNVVLTAAQEKVLFLQFNYVRFRIVELKEAIGQREVTEPEALELIKWYRKTLDLRDQIASANLALVLAMTKRIRMSDMDYADLISEGNMALLRAIDKFDVGRGFKFSTYACRAILKAFSRSGMKHTQYRQLFPTDFDPALEKSDNSRRKFDDHETDCTDEVRRIVQNNRASLTEVEDAVIRHRFPIDDESTDKPLTLEQVGQIIGLTKERVRQIQNKALAKIRNTLEEQFLDGVSHPRLSPRSFAGRRARASF